MGLLAAVVKDGLKNELTKMKRYGEYLKYKLIVISSGPNLHT